MKRLLAVVALACLAAGCKSRGETVDPFFGRTTIEPPATGACNGRSIDPYYRPTSSSPSPATVAPSATLSSPTPASATSPAVAPAPVSASASAVPSSSVPRTNAGFTSMTWGTERVPPETLSLPRQTALPTAKPNALPVVTPPPTTKSSSFAPASDPDTSLADRPRIARTLDPRPKSEPASPTGVTPANYLPGDSRDPRQPASSINIKDLPSPKSGAALSPTPTSAGEVRQLGEVTISDKSEVRTALALEPVATNAVTSFANSNYGHEQDYGVLRGKLEYSQAERRWKLRYIPIDGKMDAFGGSVVISNEAILAGFERGDIVEVHGRVNRGDPANKEQPKRGFAPFYEITEVRPLTTDHSSLTPVH